MLKQSVYHNCQQIKAVLNQSQYLLEDWHSKELTLFDAVHINQFNPCYFNLGKVQTNFWQQSLV